MRLRKLIIFLFTIVALLIFVSRRNKDFENGYVAIPNAIDLEYNNIYWQTLRTHGATFQIFGAYFDERPASASKVVRLTAMVDRVGPSTKTYCNLWYGNKCATVAADYLLIWNPKWGMPSNQYIYLPYMINCRVPRGITPKSVSLVEDRTKKPSNHLEVNYAKPKVRKSFAVCVKDVSVLEDISFRLIEWVELLLILGVEKIFFYELQTHENVKKVLQHYESKGVAHVTPTSLAGCQPNHPKFQHAFLMNHSLNKRYDEIISYNDCYYRHMYEFKYIALLDLDEFILPVKFRDWNELVNYAEAKHGLKDAYCARNVYFFGAAEVQQRHHMLGHLHRAVNLTKPTWFTKCFHSTRRSLLLHNHLAIACLTGHCNYKIMALGVAQLNHYRGNCSDSLKVADFMNATLDDKLLRYKNELMKNSEITLSALGY